MSKEEFETYLTLVSSLLQLTPDQREQISDELHDHMENRVADLVESGLDRQAAVLQAVEEFGDASVLAENLKRVNLNNRKRWMMRFATLCTAAAFFMAIFSMAMWPQDAHFGTPSKTVAQEDADPFGGDGNEGDADPFGPGSSSNPQVTNEPEPRPSISTSAELAIRRKLESECEFHYDQTSFTDVKKDLESKLGVNIVLTLGAQEDSLPEDETFTSNLTGISHANGLRILLAEKNATYCIKRGVVQIISLDEAGEPIWFTRKMTDVSDVLALIRNRDKDRIGEPDIAKLSNGFGGGGGGGVFNMQADQKSAGATQEKVTRKSDLQKLAEAIVAVQSKSKPKRQVQLITAESILLDAVKELVDQDAWDSFGGAASITCIGGILIVNASEEVNDQVEDFVADLRYQLQTAQPR